ncbi:LuxR C-terminal-related transcriptional regulator [Streptomyces sp. NPDC049887]|uniref:LuxR C-terminal-related transcriptional regulator n=1 Tax=Streptomyces sp. NPDC049887 TaxID=3155654 RepID=UPI00342ECE07
MELTSFVGRRRDVDEVRDLLSAGRLVTLTGPGGVGKSRLGLRVADRVRKAFAAGVAFVDLAPVAEGALVAYTVAEALGIEAAQSRKDPVGAVTDFLHERQVLLLLDNCEHLVDACAALTDAVLRADEQVRVLATSRQSMGVSGELVYRVDALPVPPSDLDGRLRAETAAAEYPGLALFAERAAAVTGFQLTEANCPTVARLCRRLDGLPLAIELAAIRARVLSVQQILERLDGWMQLLVAVDRQAPDRHRSLRAVVDWSYELCSPAERLLWARASVFSGWFNVEAAEGVCSGDDLPPGQVLEAVTGLVDKSVLVWEEQAGRVQYRLLETLAEYGRGLLAELGGHEAVARRHRDWFFGLAEQMRTSWFGPDELQWSRRMRSEHDNLRVALRFCLDTQGEGQTGLAMAASLHFYWFACGHLTEGRLWLERFLTLERASTRARARALRVAGLLAGMQADQEVAVNALRECKALAEKCGDPFLNAAADAAGGLAALNRGLLREAVMLAKKALASPQYAQHPEHCQALAVASCAHALLNEGDQAAAEAAELRRFGEVSGADWARSRALILAVLARLGTQDAADDERRSCQALTIARDLNDVPVICLALLMVAWSAIAAEEYERGAVLLGSCHTIWNLVGVQEAAAVYINDRFEARARFALGDTSYEDATARGRRFDMASGVDYALNTGTSQPSGEVGGRREGARSRGRKRASGPLTAREQHVAKLVALGLSNKEIAARLLISPRTVDGHVCHILAKLGFTARAQIAAWAVRHDQGVSNQRRIC